MTKLLLSAAVGLMLLSTSSYAAQREHRAGQPGYSPGGGVTVGTKTPTWHYGSHTQPKTVKVRPAPNVAHEKNWGCCTFTTVPVPIVGSGKQTSGQNVRDHRSVRN